MSKDLIYLIAYGFVMRRFGLFNGIVKQVVNKIIARNGFCSLRFLRVKGMFLFQLFNTVALSGRKIPQRFVLVSSIRP